MNNKSDTSEEPSAKDDVIDAEIISEDVNDQSTNPSPKKASRVSVGAKLGWGTSVLLIAFVGGLFAEPWISNSLVNIGLKEAPTQQQSQQNAELDALRAQLSAQSELIQKLGSKLENQAVSVAEAASQAQKTQDDLAILAASGATEQSASVADTTAVDTLRAEIAELRGLLAQQVTASPDNADVQVLEGRVEIARTETGLLKSRLAMLEAALERANSGNLRDNPRGRLALTLSDLRRKAEAGQSFSSLLDSLRLDLTMIPALDQQKAGGALAVLESHQVGVDSQLDLVSAFPALVRSVKAASAEGRTESWLASLFVTRDLKAVDQSIDAILNETEALVRSGNLIAAIKVLNELPAPAAPAAAPWTQSAQARAETLSSIDTLFKLAAGAPTQLQEAPLPIDKTGQNEPAENNPQPAPLGEPTEALTDEGGA